MPFARVRDIEVYYEFHGDGTPLVMINGLSADHSTWGCQIPAYSQKFRCLIFDNRGVGQTSKPVGPYTCRQFADDTAALMSTLGLTRDHLVGASMGGAIAQEFAINYPEKVISLPSYCSWAKSDNYLANLFATWKTLARRVSSPIELVREIYL